jgi:hypothetical protein
LAQRRQERQAVLIDQHFGVTGGKTKSALPFIAGIDYQDLGDGLLFEPFLRIALVDPAPLGQLEGGQRTVGGEPLVEAELFADIDMEKVEPPNAGFQEPFCQRVAGCVVVVHLDHLLAQSDRL